MERLSVVIITHNEEKHIARCIRSVMPVADEIIVLDSFSSDQTVRIALENGARVYQEPFRGYIAQKNRATELASWNYVLSVDADEALDDELQGSIGRAKKGFMFSAYKMKRCTNHCGRFIRYGAWYPDRKIRLFDRRVAYWGGLNPHDKIMHRKNVAVKQLPGEILHYSFSTLTEHKAQNENFSTLVAESYFHAGKRTNPLKIIINPLWTIIYGFFIRGGFLIGNHGWAIAINHARYTYMKHLKLHQLQKGKMAEKTSDIQPPAYADSLAGDIGPHVRSQEETGMGNILRGSKTA